MMIPLPEHGAVVLNPAPVSVDAWVSAPANPYPTMTYANFDVFGHYLDGFGKYGEKVVSVAGRPDGEGEYIWPKCNTKQGFEWFATTMVAKRGKDASDLRPCGTCSPV